MNLVLYTHPALSESQSMPRFARLLATGFAARGHAVSVRAPDEPLRSALQGTRWAKWGSYVDQYLLYPRQLSRLAAQDPADTLYVFCDQALGPWVPRVAHRPHVVHCHDLLALRSALGHFPQNPVRATGRAYQRYIRRGFRRARHFISISERSREDLHRWGGVGPVTSEVVYNGLNFPFCPMPQDLAERTLAAAGLAAPASGFLLHVSIGVWYKNVPGLLRLYAHYARRAAQPLPLWLVGVPERGAIDEALAEVLPQGSVQFLQGLASETLQAAYSLARAFVFPSLAEGFGWPIVEAQACGCPVITTAEAPMTEVGGPHSHYLPRLDAGADVQAWAAQGAGMLDALLALPRPAREQLSLQCVEWSRRFDAQSAIDAYLKVYQRVLDWERQHADGTAGGGAR